MNKYLEEFKRLDRYLFLHEKNALQRWFIKTKVGTIEEKLTCFKAMNILMQTVQDRANQSKGRDSNA